MAHTNTTTPQNNEAEALRSWKTALNRIHQHNATHPTPTHNATISSTDRVLQESLRQLELQCQERVDLLEVLQESRKEAAQDATTSPAAEPTDRDRETNNAGWLGAGTIPPATYTDLPSSRPPVPPRPSRPPRRASSECEAKPPPPPPHAYGTHSLSPGPAHRMEKDSRTPSPEKRTRMLRTLRQGGGKDGRRPSAPKTSSSSSSARPPVAAKAANLAFSTTAAANASRPIYRGHPGSNESLVVPQMAASASRTSLELRPSSSRTSFERPSSGRPSSERERPRDREGLASEAAARSWTDLGSDRLYAVGSRKERVERSGVRSLRPPSPNRSRVRDPLRRRTEIAVEEGVPVEAGVGGDVEDVGQKQRRTVQGQTIRRKMVPSTSQSQSEAAGPEEQDDTSDCDNPVDPWEKRVKGILKHLPRGVDGNAAKQILNEIVIHGDEVHWSDIAGLDIAKSALKETVVYPFLRPDLFMGLREPARGMLLFGPPGTGKTMLARAVATESKSTFFAISASSLTSKFLGESEKLVRALFGLAKMLAPSIIFVDEIDSLLSARSGEGEHEATRRIKTEFLIQWSDLARAAAGSERDNTKKDGEGGGGGGDATRVLVLAATNLPWVIDDAARRRFVRRQYIPLPEGHVRKEQLRTLLRRQKHELGDEELDRLVEFTEGMFFLSSPSFLFSFYLPIPIVHSFLTRTTRLLRLGHHCLGQRRCNGAIKVTRRTSAAYEYG